jgi:histidinol dehydrogenase
MNAETELIDWSSLDESQKSRALQRPGAVDPGLPQAVRVIIEQVRRGGDHALDQLTRELDRTKARRFAMGRDEMSAAAGRIHDRLTEAINDASARIRAFHAADIPTASVVETAPGLRCEVRYQPLSPVGLYIPGGSAPLVSTVLMLAIPAKLAGCGEIIMCSPPGRDGRIADEILAAAHLCGVDRVFCVGGAQAIAAMAYGTETVPRCVKLFGPGNAWVTEAKQQVSTDPEGAAIDMPAGPSEVMVIADASAGAGQGADFIAWDLLSQAEHGPDSQVLLVSDSVDLASRVVERLDALAAQTSRGEILRRSLKAARFIRVDDLDQALEVARRYAPEHLILNTANARALAARTENAGSVFIGRWTPESLGDYCSGTNHVLPTYGWARSFGALGTGDFLRRMTLQECSREALEIVGPTAETLAEVEGLDAHRMAVRARRDEQEFAE